MAMFLILILFLLLLPVLILITKSKKPLERVPPGQLGLPIIGQSFKLLWAMRSNTAEQWISARAKRYGPISKMSLFGKPTVFVHGQTANRLVFGGDGTKLSIQQTESMRMLLGERCLLELVGEDHKRLRNALTSFLKPESLKNYIGRIDEEIKLHLEANWHGKETVTVLPLMKTLTFDIICTILFGVERGAIRDALVEYFQQMIAGMWTLPINMPFTRFNRSLRAAAKVREMLKGVVHEKRIELEKGASSRQDLITCLLTIHGDDGEELISEDEIIHNIILVMVAGYDTSAVVITFLVRLLANNAQVRETVLQEQVKIKNNKPLKELLTWEDLGKMKYTWRVAMETLRMIPPIFGGFRKVMEDIEYNGYLIPKGWQVFWVTSMTHMDGDIFPEPENFDPDRFVNPASIPPYSYIPFGAGARICPGYELAKIEILSTIHYLVTEFDWKLCSRDNSYIRDPMPAPAQGLPIQLCKRKLSTTCSE
ncbi:cytochrome P450 716B1-like [Andrographis paniculata]|uniref:cytochrome P450 716B1-like n=1 Tax=Andrographis paniculata TaxID=175694 RepID=UPI0021E72B63|nr:cytochrome P450 716B1-like [Andrographis paniculata]